MALILWDTACPLNQTLYPVCDPVMRGVKLVFGIMSGGILTHPRITVNRGGRTTWTLVSLMCKILNKGKVAYVPRARRFLVGKGTTINPGPDLSRCEWGANNTCTLAELAH